MVRIRSMVTGQHLVFRTDGPGDPAAARATKSSGLNVPFALLCCSIVGNGDKIPDQEQCLKDMTYMACYKKRSNQYTTYAGLAGGSGGLLAVCALLFRYG
jgi:hypothetical protein